MFIRAIIKSLIFHLVKNAGVVIIGIFLSSWPALSKAQDVNSYTITHTSETIKIDGKLNEKAWKNAREAALIETNTGLSRLPYPLMTSGKCRRFLQKMVICGG